MQDAAHVQNIVASYRNKGFTVAIDDFGAGYAGLALLARFQPDVVKVDMELVRGVDNSVARQAIIAGIVGICRQLDITVLAEGVETRAEAEVLRAAGIRLFQGYLFARPELESFRATSDIAALAAAA
jgi:EAL domain-containing protein (putative c-di-GMP-specific phosphodiesterase class I)